MPMIDIYATAGTFRDPHTLATSAATTLKRIEEVPDIPMFRENTAAFIHDLPPGAISDVDGGGDHVRVQVLTNAGALDRTKQLAVVEQLTALIADAAGDATMTQRTWVLLTEAAPGGWGLWGHAHTNEELVAAARAEIGVPSARLTITGSADGLGSLRRTRRSARNGANTSSPSTASITRATSRRLACERGPCGDERGRGGQAMPDRRAEAARAQGRWAITFTTVPSGSWTKKRRTPHGSSVSGRRMCSPRRSASA